MLIRLAVLGLLVSVCLGKSLQTSETSSTDSESTISVAVVENEITNSYDTENMEVQDNSPDDMQEPKAEDLIAQEHVDEDELDREDGEDDEDDEDEDDESVQGGFKLPFPLPSLPSLPGIHLPAILPSHPPSWMPYPRAWLHHLLPAYYPHPLPPHVVPPPPHMVHPAGTYLKPMQPEAESPVSSSRRRRGAPLRKIETKDPSEWWYDLDGAHKNEVTEDLRRKAGFATYKHIEKQMDHFAPAIHIGKINMGLKSNPELEHPSRASVGVKADWNPEDYENAFAFQRHGQHVAWDMYELLRYFKAGKLPPGKKFIVSKKLVSPYSQCWFSHTNRESFEELRVIDFTSVAARAKYWERDDCRHFQPGVYELVAIKETLKDPSGKVSDDEDLTGGVDVPVTGDEPDTLAEEDIVSEVEDRFKKRRKRSLGRKKRSESEFDFDLHDSDDHDFDHHDPSVHDSLHHDSDHHDSLHHEFAHHDSLHHESSHHDSLHHESSHHSPLHDSHHFDAYRHDHLQLKSVLIILKEVRTHYHGGRGYTAVLNFNPQALQEFSPVKVKSSHSKLVQESADGKVTKKFWFRQNAIPAGLNHQDTKSGSKVGFNDYRKPLTDHAEYENTLVWGKPVMTKPKAIIY